MKGPASSPPPDPVAKRISARPPVPAVADANGPNSLAAQRSRPNGAHLRAGPERLTPAPTV